MIIADFIIFLFSFRNYIFPLGIYLYLNFYLLPFSLPSSPSISAFLALCTSMSKCVCVWLYGSVSVCTHLIRPKAPVTEALSNHSAYQWVTALPILTQLFSVKDQAAQTDAQTGRSLFWLSITEGNAHRWGSSLTCRAQSDAKKLKSWDHSGRKKKEA